MNLLLKPHGNVVPVFPPPPELQPRTRRKRKITRDEWLGIAIRPEDGRTEPWDGVRW
jgi:hypothetical protein